MHISLSDHFTYKKLLRFTLPSIVMMIFTSIYGVVDGFFVSNYVGKTSFTAATFIYPYIMILGGLGFIFGTGGSALVAKTMGEGEPERAEKQFSLIVYTSIVLGLVIMAVGLLLLRPIAIALGGSGQMLEDAVVYGRVNLFAVPFYVLQYEFESFFVTAEKPKLGLYVTVAAGVTNMVLDALFIVVFKWGIVGAASATALSIVVGGAVPLLYFARPNSSTLHLVKTEFDAKVLLRTTSNGASELMSTISMSLVSMLYNAQLIKYAGNDGVAAYGVLMYVNMIFLALFIGYSVGTAPVISYNYGAENHAELKSLLRKSLKIIAVFAVLMVIAAKGLARPLSMIFVGYDEGLLNLTLRGFAVYSYSFLFCGFAIYGSGFFTALNNGLISALIAFLRTLVFEIAAVMLLPIAFGVDGIWASIVVAEVMAVIITAIFMLAMRKRYQY